MTRRNQLKSLAASALPVTLALRLPRRCVELRRILIEVDSPEPAF